MFSVHLLITIADCVAALAASAEKRRNLNHRQVNLTFTGENTTSTVAEMMAQLTDAIAEEASLTTTVAGLPASTLKKKRTTELRRATDRREELEDKMTYRGPADILSRELDLKNVLDALARLDVFDTEVAARKIEIAAAG